MYLGVDPGDTSGFALFETPEKMLDWGNVKYDDFLDWLATLPDGITVVIVESFQLFQHKAVQQSGSKMKASQIFGMLKMYAKKIGAEFVEQPPTIKAFAEKQTKLVPKGAHINSHRVDAFNHCYYYFIKNKLVEVRTG